MKLPSELALDCAYMHERTEWICHLSKGPCPSLPGAHCYQEYTAYMGCGLCNCLFRSQALSLIHTKTMTVPKLKLQIKLPKLRPASNVSPLIFCMQTLYH